MDLDLFFSHLEPNECLELRILEPNGAPGVASGYFRDPAKMLAEAHRLTKVGGNAYITINPANLDLAARTGLDRAQSKKGIPTTSDRDITRRTHILFDLDFQRPAGIPASDTELQAALDLAVYIEATLADEGWPTPNIINSGNGAHLLYAVDMPNTPESLATIKAILAWAQKRFCAPDDSGVQVDQSVANAARISRIPGTLNRKGAGTEQRPHRMASIIQSAPRVLVSPAILDAFRDPTGPSKAQDGQRPSKSSERPKRANAEATGRKFDVEEFVRQNLPEAVGPIPYDGGRKWQLRTCPWNPEHDNNSGYVIERADGKLAAGCLHNSCAHRSWSDLREMFDPKHLRESFDSKPAQKPAAKISQEAHQETGITIELPPGTPELLAPDNYMVTPNGIYLLIRDPEGNETWSQRWEVPIVITDRVRDSVSQKVSLALYWPEAGKIYLDPGVVADHRGLAKTLSAYGYPIHSDKAKPLVEYLRQFQLKNEEALALKNASQSLGWWKKPTTQKPTFILGNHVVGEDVSFAAPDGGQTICDALRTHGTYQGWIDTISCLKGQPRALLAIYASFAAPLLHAINAQGFVVDICGETSRGKTTILKACASIYGDPDVSGGGLIQGWKSTQAAIERRAGILKNLPIILDDTRSLSAVERKTMVASIIYMLAQGRGKERGSLNGIRKTPEWLTVSIVSGEGSIVSMSTESGKNTRMLTIWGDPFNGPPNLQREIVHKLNRGCQRNFGWAGRDWIGFLQKNFPLWPEWNREWESIRACYEQYGSGSSQLERLAGYLAAIELAGKLAHQALPIPFDYEPVPDWLCRKIFCVIDESDSPREALRWAYDWACSNPNRFYGRHSGYTEVQPPLGWAGRWDEKDDWEYLAFFPNVLEKILREGDFDPAEIRKRWGDRGWIQKSKDGCLSVPRRVGREIAKMVSINRDSIEKQVVA